MAGIVYLFRVPLKESFSYRFVQGECDDKGSWIYHRIFQDDRDIDIAFSGASQTGSAIMDKLIQNQLNDSCGHQLQVANLGYCRRGRDLQYVMLKDLFEQKTPEVLVVEVYEDEPKKSHPVFPYLAGTNELFGSCVWFNRRFPSALWKGLIVRFEFFKHRLFDKKFVKPEDLSEFGYLPSGHIASPEILEHNRNNWQRRLSRSKPESIRNWELNYSKHYLKKIVQLANQNNCEVLFLYLPESGSGIRQPALAEFYSQLATIIYLPEEIVQTPSNWKDATHFNDSGASYVSLYLNTLLEEFYTN